MRKRLWLVTLLVVGCKLEVSFDDTRYFCGSGGSCPTGQSCIEDFCEPRIGSPVDADPFSPDAEVPEPGIDAGPGDPDAAASPDASSPPPDAAPPPPPDAAPPPPDAAVPCTLGKIADDFATSAVAPFWVPFNEGPTTVSETSGRLVVSMQQGASGSNFAGYVYRSNTDARAQKITVEVVVTPNSASLANAFFKIQNGTNYDNQATFGLEGGVLYMDTYDASYNRLSRRSITYNATDHRFWALEEQNGQILFLTSPNNLSWTLWHQPALPFPAANARVALGGGTWRAESTSPGTVQFQGINSGPSTNCFGVAE